VQEEKPKTLGQETPKYKTLAKLQNAFIEGNVGPNIVHLYVETEERGIEEALLASEGRGKKRTHTLLWRGSGRDLLVFLLKQNGFNVKQVAISAADVK
jgi:hypothetical protein